MKSIEKSNSFIVATTGISILQTAALKEYNPNIKMLLGFLPGMYLSRSKKQHVKYWGESLMAGSIIGYTINILERNNCDYSYSNNLSKQNSVLVNINTGRIIEKIGKPHFIYVTKNNSAKVGWQSSSPLLHCIKKLIFWHSMVNDYKPLDIKRKEFHPSAVSEWSIYNNTLVRYDDYGNILYGAIGTAFGITEADLFFGANMNQILKSGLDESKDTYSIQRGIAIYNNHIARKQLSNPMLYV